MKEIASAIVWTGAVAAACFLIWIAQPVWAGVILGLSFLAFLVIVADGKKKAQPTMTTVNSFQAGTKH